MDDHKTSIPKLREAAELLKRCGRSIFATEIYNIIVEFEHNEPESHPSVWDLIEKIRWACKDEMKSFIDHIDAHS